MSDYAKKTVAELQEILKTRRLPSSGKKAELIARLNENDKQASEDTPAEPESEVAPAAEAVQPATDTVEEPAVTEPTTTTDEAPADPTATADEHPSPDTALASQTDFALNLPTSSLDNELAKRKARAERFGTGPSATADQDAPEATSTAEPVSEDAAALKNLERAKRFGTGQTAIGKLDEALPSELARGSRKRGHGAIADGVELDDPGLKRSFQARGRGGRSRGAGRSRGGNRPGAPAAKPQGVQKAQPAFTNDKDRLAAEARKKKFATA